VGVTATGSVRSWLALPKNRIDCGDLSGRVGISTASYRGPERPLGTKMADRVWNVDPSRGYHDARLLAGLLAMDDELCPAWAGDSFGISHPPGSRLRSI